MAGYHCMRLFYTPPENIKALLRDVTDVLLRNKISVIEPLIEAGINPKAKDTNGKSPWNYAQKRRTKRYQKLSGA